MKDYLIYTLKDFLTSMICMLLIFSLFALALGISDLVGEPTNVVEGLSIVTHAAELYGRIGEHVIIDAEIEYTGIYANYSPTNRTTRSHHSTQHLFIINFEDAPIAFTSNHNDIHFLDGTVIGSIGKMPSDFIAERLLNRYLLDNSEFSQYTLRDSIRFTVATFEEHHERAVSSVFWSAIFAVGFALVLILTIRLLYWRK